MAYEPKSCGTPKIFHAPALLDKNTFDNHPFSLGFRFQPLGWKLSRETIEGARRPPSFLD